MVRFVYYAIFVPVVHGICSLICLVRGRHNWRRYEDDMLVEMDCRTCAKVETTYKPAAQERLARFR